MLNHQSDLFKHSNQTIVTMTIFTQKWSSQTPHSAWDDCFSPFDHVTHIVGTLNKLDVFRLETSWYQTLYDLHLSIAVPDSAKGSSVIGRWLSGDTPITPRPNPRFSYLTSTDPYRSIQIHTVIVTNRLFSVMQSLCNNNNNRHTIEINSTYYVHKSWRHEPYWGEYGPDLHQSDGIPRLYYMK